MANINYRSIVKRRRIFYLCTCPDRPISRRHSDIINWYMDHLSNCPPRPVVDLYLPGFEEVE